MEGQEGVQNTEGTVTDSSPESEAQSNTQATQPEVQSQPKGKDYNFKQLRESVNRLEQERKTWLEEKQKLQGAAQLDQMLRTDPRTGLKQIAQALGIDIKTLIEAEKAAQSEMPQIDFEQYEPKTAQLLKFLHDRAAKVEQLEQWKEQFEQKTELTQRQQQEAFIEKNVSVLENRFRDDLIKDGFLDKDGNGDQDVVELIRSAVVEKLAQQGDPRLATLEQYQAARAQVLKGLSAHKNTTLKNTVTKDVPATGSRNGAATTAKIPVTREQRLAFLADMAKSNPNWGFDS